MIQFLDVYRDRFRARLIGRELANTAGGFMTSRGYRAAKSRPLSDRAIRDQALGNEMKRLHAGNYGVYGVRRMYCLMRRQGWLLARDQVARVMKAGRITAVKRGKTTFATETKTSDSYLRTEFKGSSLQGSQTKSGWRMLRMSLRFMGLRMWGLSLTCFPTRLLAGPCHQH